MVFPKNPEYYELRLIDDDEYSDTSSENEEKVEKFGKKEKVHFKPNYDFSSLDYNGEVGEFESLAFVEVAKDTK